MCVWCAVCLQAATAAAAGRTGGSPERRADCLRPFPGNPMKRLSISLYHTNHCNNKEDISGTRINDDENAIYQKCTYLECLWRRC